MAQTGIEIDGVPLSNAGGETFGDIDMDFALTHSVNTYFAQVGEKLGTETMFEYMNRFGFYKDPELDYPDDQMSAERGLRRERQRCSTPATRSTSAASRSARSGC